MSCDQLTNIVLNNTTERIIRPREDPEPSSEVPHGLYLVRGDNITICGLVEEELDASIDWTKVVCKPCGTCWKSLTLIREGKSLEVQSTYEGPRRERSRLICVLATMYEVFIIEQWLRLDPRSESVFGNRTGKMSLP